MCVILALYVCTSYILVTCSFLNIHVFFNVLHLHLHLCIYQTLLSKATYSALMLYIFLSVHGGFQYIVKVKADIGNVVY